MSYFLKSSPLKFIILLSLWIVGISNQTFFFKLFSFGIAEENYPLLILVPMIYFLLILGALNLLTIITYKKSLKVFAAFLIVVSSISSYFMDTFGVIIDKDMITNVYETDIKEASDLMTVSFLIHFILTAVFPSLFIWKVKFSESSYVKELMKKLICIGVSFSLAIGLYFVFSKHINPFFRNHKEMRMYLNPSYPIQSVIRFIKVQIKAKSYKALVPIGEDATKVQQEKKRLFVLIVGETARAANFSLNGYSVKTNEKLELRKDILNFSNFYSCGTMTSVSVPCLFSKFSRDEFGDDKLHYENLVDILQKTNTRVIWRDNNSGGSKGVADRIKDAKYLGGDPFDETMLQGIQESLDEIYEDTLIVFHQEGSHGPAYYKRYPKAFERFTPICTKPTLDQCTREEVVNVYDNTILYTDYFINETIEVAKKNSEKYETMFLYVSDHGESLGENNIYLHAMPYFIAPDGQKHVPAVMYFGESLKHYKELLATKTNNSFSHDNVFHTVLSFFHVMTKDYKPELDMLK